MFDCSKHLAKQFAEAKRRLEATSKFVSQKHDGDAWKEFNSAYEDVLRLERELAKSKGEPYAVPCNFPVKWDMGAPLPFLLCNDYRTFLTFYISDPDPNWDGTDVNVIHPASEEKASLCLVTFKNCASAKLGHPNDEVQGGHPLSGRGLDGYTAQSVINSPWIKEVAKTNSVHSYDNPERWSLLNHFIFWFHDSTFECLAESYEIEVTSESMCELLGRVQVKLLE